LKMMSSFQFPATTITISPTMWLPLWFAIFSSDCVVVVCHHALAILRSCIVVIFSSLSFVGFYKGPSLVRNISCLLLLESGEKKVRKC
jgi:hypothetical protein